MYKLFFLSLVIVSLSVGGLGQTGPTAKAAADNAVTASADSTASASANAAITAHGGEKVTKLKTLVMRGSVDITGPFSQVIPATFVLVTSGEKYLFELKNAMQPLKQVYDGNQKQSSGFELPPMSSLGFPLLPKVGQAGYVVSALPEAKRKKKGFRITTPEGYYTDFYVNDKTNQIKSYESSYEVMGRLVTTSVEVDEMATVDGVIVPKRYSQRFDLGPTTAYANFKAKEILINSTLTDDVFAIGK